MVYLTNAFSINMLERKFHRVVFMPLSLGGIREFLTPSEWVSAIGHQDTANVVGELLGVDVPCNRTTIQFKESDTVIVAQYTGTRLPEGATQLPEGAEITFWAVQHEGA